MRHVLPAVSMVLMAAAVACGGEPAGGGDDAAAGDVRLHLADGGAGPSRDAGAADSGPADGGQTDAGHVDVGGDAHAFPDAGQDAGLDAAHPDGGADTGVDGGTGDEGVLLEVHHLDIWGRPLEEATLLITGPDGRPVVWTGATVASARMAAPGRYRVEAGARYHDTVAVDLVFDGRDAADAVSAERASGMGHQGLSVSHDQRTVGGRLQWAHTVYLGLRHHYFAASGRPPRSGNLVEFLMDGEEAWGRVYDRLKLAQRSVEQVSWWWVSDFEYKRPWATHAQMTAAERKLNTALYALTSVPAYKRLMIGQFWGQDGLLKWLTTDADLRRLAEAPNDDFEFMGQANESEGVFEVALSPVEFARRVKGVQPQLSSRAFDPEEPVPPDVGPYLVDMTDYPGGVSVEIASYHQKFMAIDDREAFLGGMNVKEADWDGSGHLVFDHRRMNFSADAAARQAVIDKTTEPDMGPRKDYMLHVQGPAAGDVIDLFHERWKYLLDSRVDYSENASDFTVPPSIVPYPGGITMQLTATLPAPFFENSILESQINAVRHAERFIYIEDQYFRAPVLFDEIIARMQEKPGLILLAITKPISEWTDPGCRWTYESHRSFKNAVPDRYMLMQLRSFDTVVTWGIDETECRFKDIDVHAKMLIVDDLYMSVGSCNKNNRGLLYEGESNFSIVDPTFVSAARKRIFSNLVGRQVDADDPAEMWVILRDAAVWNDQVYANWDAEGGDIDLGDGTDPLPPEYRPVGFVYSMDFPDVSECLIENIGPDVTFW